MIAFCQYGLLKRDDDDDDDELIIWKIIKFVATRCHILKVKIHQIRFRLGLRPRPH